MLSYRHAFHAGNYADVVKHITLNLIMQALRRKDTPFCYLDTHAGTAFYDLNSQFAQKTGEFKEGIELLWRLPETAIHPLATHYMQALRAFNPGQRLNMYIGSAAIARNFLRSNDSMNLMELHPTDVELLKSQFKNDKQVHIHQRDGLEGLIALVPPKQKRGLVLIDPAYELKQDYIEVVETLKIAHKRWQNGIYMLWYPLLSEQAYQQKMLKKLGSSGIKKILVAELNRYPSHTPRAMYGTGLVIINPPYQLEQALKELLPWLWQVLSPQGEGEWRVEWLVGE
jgi:23S rRNA (adenine2030-N6)-methyltransferase